MERRKKGRKSKRESESLREAKMERDKWQENRKNEGRKGGGCDRNENVSEAKGNKGEIEDKE